jgi:filamentous hemagglutinin
VVTINAPRAISTTGDAVSFATNVTLAGGTTGAPTTASLDTTAGGNAAGANVTFSAAVSGSTAGAENLTIDSGTGGDVLFAGAVGMTPLHDIVVTGFDITFNGAVTTANSGDLTIFTNTPGGTLTINAPINADGDVTVNGVGTTLLSSDITTTNDLVRFDQPVLLVGNRLIDTSNAPAGGTFGGRIHFANSLNGGGNSLTLTTPGATGDVLFDQAVGNLSALTIVNAANIDAAGSIATNAGGPIAMTAQGTATFLSPVTAGGPVTLRVNDLALNSTIGAGANAVQITPATASRAVTIGALGAGTLQLSQAELNAITTTGLLTVGDAAQTGAITIAGTLTSLPGAAGGFTILNNTGGIAVNAPLTYTAGAGNLTLTANGGGAISGAITDNGAGLITATNLAFNAASGIGTVANPMHVTGTNIAATNTTSGGVFLLFPTGDVNLTGLSNSSNGTASLSATDGSINVSGAVTASGAVELTANATGTTARVIDIDAPVTSSGKAILRAADDITVDAQVSSGGGDVYIVAGRASGMNLPGITMADGVTAMTPAGETVPDSDGGVTLNANVVAGAGNIVINATESVVQPTGVGGTAGLQNSGTLTVRTYNDAAGGAVIDLQNNANGSGNTNGPVTLETRLANDASAPGEPAGSYAASNIDYRSYTGVVLSGIGTSGDFVAIAATQNIDLNALGLQAKNLTLIANAGDVNVNIQVTDSQINGGNPGGSLNLLASGNVNVNPVAGTGGVTIGRILPGPTLDPDTSLPVDASIETFDHDLKLVAQGDINLRGSIYLQGDLRLRADASLAEATTIGGAVGYGDGAGSVNISVPGADPVIVRAGNIIVGTKDALNKPLPVQNLTLTGGSIVPGAGVRQSAYAHLEATGSLEIFLGGDMALTGGTISANNPTPGTVIDNAAFAKVEGRVVTIRGLTDADNPGVGLPVANTSNITLLGGTATAANQGVAIADASALIVAAQSAEITIGGLLVSGPGGDFAITGGTASATGSGASAMAIAGTEIGTQITGIELLNVGARNIFITSGTGIVDPVTGGAADAFAGLASSGAIRIATTGNGLNEGLVLDGAGGSGLFDALGPTLIRVTGISYPITISGQIALLSAAAAPRRDAFVIAGAPLIDESLLAAFLRATEATREETFAQDPNLQQRNPSKSAPNVCK